MTFYIEITESVSVYENELRREPNPFNEEQTNRLIEAFSKGLAAYSRTVTEEVLELEKVD